MSEYSVRVIIPPEPIVDIDDVKAAIREDWSDDDAYLQVAVDAAIQHIDAPRGWLGRALGGQTLEASFCDWGDRSLRLPFPPIIDVVSVKYLDGDSEEQTVDASSYILTRDLVWFKPTWTAPSLACHPAPVTVRYRAGFATVDGESLVDEVPEPIRAAIMLHAAHLYRNREATSDKPVTAVPLGYEALLSTFHIWAI